MSTLPEIANAISRLPISDVQSFQEWLGQWLEDQQRMTPEFLASIDNGKAELAAGQHRTVRP